MRLSSLFFQILLNESGEVDPDKFVGKVKETVSNVRRASICSCTVDLNI